LATLILLLHSDPLPDATTFDIATNNNIWATDKQTVEQTDGQQSRVKSRFVPGLNIYYSRRISI